MTIWIILTVMISMACAGLAVALVRRQEAAPARLGDSEALARQLADIAAQAAAGTLPNETAETLRAETIRRFLAEDAVPTRPGRPLSKGALSLAAVVVAGGVALGASLLYAELGRPDLADPVATQASPGLGTGDATNPSVQLAGLIVRLEARARRSPNDVSTLKALGAAFIQAERYADAAAAYGRAARLAPRDGEAASAEGEALTRAAQGTITAKARAAFAAAVANDPGDPRARYFLAAYKDQEGDHAGAMAEWIALINSAPPGAPWVAQVRAAVEQTAARDHMDIAGRLPPPAAGAAAQVAAMSPGAQKGMIASMVGRLDARLKANPKDPEGWINLMRARMVLGDRQAATAAYHRALVGDGPDRIRITAAARQFGVPGA